MAPVGSKRSLIKKLEALSKISKAISSDLYLEDILRLIVVVTAEVMKSKVCSLWLVDERDKALKIRATQSISPEYLKERSLKIGEGVVGYVAEENKPMMIYNVLKEPRYKEKDLARKEGLVSMLSVPMSVKDKVIGVINCYTSYPHKFTRSEVEVFTAVANQAAIAIENAGLIMQLFQSEKLAALGKLSAGIAHEIRNPLTSIKILIHSLVDEKATDSSREKDLAVIESEIERVNQIIKQFLDFARPRPPSLELLDVQKVLEETIALLIYEIEARAILLEKQYAPKLPPLPMDREQMKQVFLNLLLNAIQAMNQSGKLKVSIAYRHSLPGIQGGPSVEISFQDSGKGIPEELKTRIFEPFFSTKEEGVGLGLPIAQRIIKEHGGEIRLESSLGEGTIVYLTLPLKERRRSKQGG